MTPADRLLTTVATMDSKARLSLLRRAIAEAIARTGADHHLIEMVIKVVSMMDEGEPDKRRLKASRKALGTGVQNDFRIAPVSPSAYIVEAGHIVCFILLDDCEEVEDSMAVTAVLYCAYAVCGRLSVPVRKADESLTICEEEFIRECLKS